MTARLGTSLQAVLDQAGVQLKRSSRVAELLAEHRMHYAYGPDAACLCKWVPTTPAIWDSEHREHVADVLDAHVAEIRADMVEQFAGLLAEVRSDLRPRANVKDVLGWLDDAVKAMGGAS